MNPLAIVIPAYLISAGIMLYSGAQAALMRFAAQQRPLHWCYAAMCLCAASYQFATAAYYRAETLPAAALALHWQTASIGAVSVAFFAFVSRYTRQPHSAAWLGLVCAVAAATVGADLLSPSGIRFQALVPAEPLRMPWGEALGHVQGRSGLAHRGALFGPPLGIGLWALYRARVLFGTGERRLALLLAACVLLLIGTGFWGASIDAGRVRSVYLAGFGFMGLVFLMNVSLARDQAQTMADLRAERDRLQAARAQLEASELRLRLVLKGTNDAWWDWDIATGEQSYSARGWEMLGYAPDEMRCDAGLWDRLVMPEDREAGTRALLAAIDGGAENYSFELRLRHRDGHAVPVLCRGYILRNAQGQAIRVSGTDTDLTDRKQAAMALQAEQQLNEQIFAHSPIGIAIFDAAGGCVAANEAMARQVGGSVGRLLQQNCHHIESWRRSGMHALATHTLETGEPRSGVLRLVTTFGRDVWLNVNFRRLPGNGRGRLLLMTDDLTEFKRTEIDRQDILDNYEMLFASSIDGVLHTRPDGAILKANPAACAMLGLSEPELRRRGRDGVIDLDDPRWPERLEERARLGRTRGEVTLLRADGERFEAEISSAVYRNREGTLLASTFVRDITERKRAEAQTHQLAYYDELTCLPNRRLLLDRIAQSLQASRRAGSYGTLLFLDLDNFKRLNDAKGHSVGDSLLTEVARRLTQLMRGADMVARLGGDEFVVLADNLGADPEAAARAAMAVAERVRSVLERPYLIDGNLYSGTGSIGLTMFPKGQEAVDDLLREADTAMYRAKATGRNRIAYYETAMQAEVEERLALEQDLKEALDGDQLSVYVQPQVNAAGEEVGGELLLRWQHPRRGALAPSFFIPIAEESGLIVSLGDMVLRRACAALARIAAAGLPQSLSVNISPRQFRQEDFVGRVRTLLQEAHAPPGRLILEVTEGLLVEDWQNVASRMTELATMGIRFSIDDFGTGYSSLSYLKKLPLHEIKIDKSFVQNTPDDANDRAIVRSILAVARAFKLRVVAEGVETQAQADFLARLQCGYLQGFLFARPLPLEAWLAQRLSVALAG